LNLAAAAVLRAHDEQYTSDIFTYFQHKVNSVKSYQHANQSHAHQNGNSGRTIDNREQKDGNETFFMHSLGRDFLLSVIDLRKYIFWMWFIGIWDDNIILMSFKSIFC
jgi:hypothetical protein